MTLSELSRRVRATMKSEDTEGPFEQWVTRTPGYLWALLFRVLGVHPVVVTLCSIVVGAAAGVLFGSDDLMTNVCGMCLLVVANWWDCADGQLARLTGQTTQLGRVLDGFGGEVWFFSIYFFLCMRLDGEVAPWGGEWGVWIWVIALVAGVRCHARQCALADYYRNVHIYYQKGAGASELVRSEDLLRAMRGLVRRRGVWFRRVYLYFYAAYTRGQERQTPQYQRFRAVSERCFGAELPFRWRERFRRESLPLMVWANVLTFDLRVGVLFLTLLMGVPWVYFVFEIVVFEPLRYYVRGRHERFCREFADELSGG